MGYNTYFSGEMEISPPLTKPEYERFSQVVIFWNSDTIAARAQADVFGDGLTPLTDADRKLVTNDESVFHLFPNKIAAQEESVRAYGNEDTYPVIAQWLTQNGHALSGSITWDGDGSSDQGMIWAETIDGKILIEAVPDEIDNPGPSWSKPVPPPDALPDLQQSRAFTPRELATILHGLRMIQCEGRIEGCLAGDCEHFEDYPALSNEEIDTLAESINLGFTKAVPRGN